jgi:hypothetical protein
VVTPLWWVESTRRLDVDRDMFMRTLRPVLLATLAAGGLWSPAPAAAAPQLQLFYAVHVHALGMEASAFDTSLAQLDRGAAKNLADGMVALGDTLESHGARASFQLTEAALSAVCTVAGPQVLQGLAAEGHDVGVHGHDPSEIVSAAAALQRQCGLKAVTGSGLVGPGTVRSGGGMSRPPRGGGGARRPPGGGGGGGMAPGLDPQVFVDGATDAQGGGLVVLTLNATPSAAREPAISRSCSRRFGANAASSPSSGALPLAWRPNLGAGDICGDGGRGLVLLDHAPGDWLLDPLGSGRDSVDLAGDTEFAQLKPLLQAALSAPEAGGRTQSWGFVSHLHEFMPGTTGTAPVSGESLAAFDRWLSWVDRTTAGQATWSTPPEIAAQAP